MHMTGVAPLDYDVDDPIANAREYASHSKLLKGSSVMFVSTQATCLSSATCLFRNLSLHCYVSLRNAQASC